MTYFKRSPAVLIGPSGVMLVLTRVKAKAVFVNITWTVRPVDTKLVRTHNQREVSRGL